MKDTISKFEELLKLGATYISSASAPDLSHKSGAEKWSKKEILGHLIDSGINNLQRFTEIQFGAKPYKIRGYDQVELVRANLYQDSEVNEILGFWMSVNQRIKFLMGRQTEESLSYKIEMINGSEVDLRFLMNDYVEHLEHHLKQIMETSTTV